jgi:outer membrane protein assembly factor BamB
MATETLGGNTIVIDLGLDRGEPETYSSPTRSTVPDWFRPLMIAVLGLIALGASAAPPPPVLTSLLSLRIGPADSYTISDSGQLLAQTDGTLTSYDLADGSAQWETPTPVPTYRIRVGDGVALLRPWAIGPGQPKTAAVDASTGAPRWSRAGSVMTIPGSPALLAVSGVRTLSTASRRIQGPVQAVDPVTGNTRWQVDVPSTAVLLGVPGPAGSPPRMLLVRDDRTMAVHDLSTGRLLAEAPLPPADYDPDNPGVSGGLLVLRHAAAWSTGVSEISAYDPVTLALRWRRPAGGAYDPKACGPLTCLVGPDGVQALDPANGAIRWFEPDWRSVEQRGDLLIAYASPGGISDPVGIIDPATGRVLVDLHGWRVLSSPAGGDEVLVTRVVEAGARSIVAVARPGDPQPRLIADLPAGTGDCQAVPDRLVCRSVTGELNVWAYRVKG